LARVTVLLFLGGGYCPVRPVPGRSAYVLRRNLSLKVALLLSTTR
jgi:hypothetical protein